MQLFDLDLDAIAGLSMAETGPWQEA